MTLDLIYTTTSDRLRLPGVLFAPDKPADTCLVVVHGMSGNILENYWADVLSRELAKSGIACIYGHNRGYGMISDPIFTEWDPQKHGFKSLRAGAVYERFADCVLDIASWVNTAKELGYSKVILLGHSLGGPKVLKYYSAHHPAEVSAVILASPADMPGLNQKYEPKHDQLLAEAHINLKSGQPHKLLSSQIYGWYYLSSQTFLDLFEENGPADVFPVLRNPSDFPELASISVPLLVFYGEHDDSYVLSSPQEDLDRVKIKASGSPSVSTVIVPAADHNYQDRELELAGIVLKWLKNL